MSAYVHETLEQIARAARAVIPCEGCRHFLLSAVNEEAAPAAYAMAASAWERGAFGGATLEEIRHTMKDVLRQAYYLCPFCSPD